MNELVQLQVSIICGGAENEAQLASMRSGCLWPISPSRGLHIGDSVNPMVDAVNLGLYTLGEKPSTPYHTVP